MYQMLDQFHAFWQLQFSHVDGLVQFQLTHIHRDKFWQIARQASDVDFGDHVANLAAAGFNARCGFFIEEMQRHFDVDFVRFVDALEVYVDESGSKAVIVTLLHKPDVGDDDKDKTKSIHDRPIYGCIVAEQRISGGKVMQ